VEHDRELKRQDYAVVMDKCDGYYPDDSSIGDLFLRELRIKKPRWKGWHLTVNNIDIDTSDHIVKCNKCFLDITLPIRVYGAMVIDDDEYEFYCPDCKDMKASFLA